MTRAADWLHLSAHPGIRPTRRQVSLSLLPTFAALVFALFFYTQSSDSSGERSAQQTHEVTYPATLISELPLPEGTDWLLPAASVRVGEALYVLDTGHNRVVQVDADGGIVRTLDATTDSRLRLQQPMAIATDGTSLFVTNSEPGQVLVISLEGRVTDVLSPAPILPGEDPIRLIGVAVSGDHIITSDADNHRVLILDRQGTLVRAVGTGSRADGESGFNVPSGLTVDADGNIYVVDTLGGRVVKLSPEGDFLGQFGSLGGSAGLLSRPKGVAVGAQGHVFVSDTILDAVVVYGPDGSYLGGIGRRVRTDPHSDLLFEAPAGLWLDGDELTVTDRYAGVFRFKVSDLWFR